MEVQWRSKRRVQARGGLLCGSNIRLMVPATLAASRAMMNSWPSEETRVTWDGSFEGSVGAIVGGRFWRWRNMGVGVFYSPMQDSFGFEVVDARLD